MQLAEVAIKWLKFEEVKKAISLLLITDCLVVCIAAYPKFAVCQGV